MWESGFGTYRNVRNVWNVPKHAERIRTCRNVPERTVPYWNVSKRVETYRNVLEPTRKYRKIRQSAAMAYSGMAIATD